MYTLGAKVVYFGRLLPISRTSEPESFPDTTVDSVFFSISHFKSCCNVRPPCVGLLAVQEGTSQAFFLLRKEPRVQLNFLDACFPECRKKFLCRCSPPGVAPSGRVQQDHFIF